MLNREDHEEEDEQQQQQEEEEEDDESEEEDEQQEEEEEADESEEEDSPEDDEDSTEGEEEHPPAATGTCTNPSSGTEHHQQRNNNSRQNSSYSHGHTGTCTCTCRKDASPDIASDTSWQSVSPIPPAAFAVCYDVLGVIFLYCDTATHLQLRLVCRAWCEHEVLHSFYSATAVLKEIRQDMGKEQRAFPDDNPLSRLRRSFSTCLERHGLVARNPFGGGGSGGSGGGGFVRSASDLLFAGGYYEKELEDDPWGMKLSLMESAVESAQQREEEYDMVDEGWVVEKHGARRTDSVTICVVESERFFRFGHGPAGWKKQRLPGDPPTWQRTDAKEQVLVEGLDSVMADPLDWEWIDHAWRVQLSTNATDLDGWRYASAFSVGQFGPQQTMFSRVRRRIWMRRLAPPTTRSYLRTESPEE